MVFFRIKRVQRSSPKARHLNLIKDVGAKRDQDTAGGRSEISCRREKKLYRRGFMVRRCVNERIEFAQSKGCRDDSKHAR